MKTQTGPNLRFITSLFFGGFALAILFAGWTKPDVETSVAGPAFTTNIIVQPVVRRIPFKASRAPRLCLKGTGKGKSGKIFAVKVRPNKFHLDHVVSSEVED